MKVHGLNPLNRIILAVVGIALVALTAPRNAHAYDCYNKQLVILDDTVTAESKCASEKLEGINAYIEFAGSGCSEYKSILSELKSIQTRSKSLYNDASSKDSRLKEKMNAASSEFGNTGKAHYRKERYENWWGAYKDLLTNAGKINTEMKSAAHVTTTTTSGAGNSSMEYGLTSNTDLPCTKTSAPTASAANSAASGSATGSGQPSASPSPRRSPLTVTGPTPLATPSPRRSSIPSDDLFDECKDSEITSKKTFCGKRYECILWKEVR